MRREDEIALLAERCSWRKAALDCIIDQYDRALADPGWAWVDQGARDNAELVLSMAVVERAELDGMLRGMAN